LHRVVGEFEAKMLSDNTAVSLVSKTGMNDRYVNYVELRMKMLKAFAKSRQNLLR